jgi:ABC-type phosphate/phosphonate transport system substrate-binding protein
MRALRFLTYLAPSLPRELFELVARHAGEALGVPVELAVESRFSGPPRGAPDPFSSGEADVGFLCAPPYLWLRERDPSPVELVPAAFVFDDPRAAGAPVYFADVIVAADRPERSFAELRGGVWAYNDPCSLSGYYCLERQRTLAPDGRFFAAERASGSHLASMAEVASGRADAAAIDSNVLRLHLAHDPALASRLRILESWGPFPIQPIVARATLGRDLRLALALAWRTMTVSPPLAAQLAAFGLHGFAPIDPGAYGDGLRFLGSFRETVANIAYSR